MKRFPLVPILMVVLLLFVGCATSPTSPSSSSATATSRTDQPACQALAKIDSSLTTLSKSGGNITIGQVKSVQAQISLALNVISRVVSSNSNVSATIGKLTAANDKIGAAVEGLPDGDTLGQHSDRLQQFKAGVASAQTSVSQLATKLNCSA